MNLVTSGKLKIVALGVYNESSIASKYITVITYSKL